MNDSSNEIPGEVEYMCTVTRKDAECIITALGFIIDQKEGVISGENLARFECVQGRFKSLLKLMKENGHER